METVFIKSIKECLGENIRNPRAFFIFSTDIASRTWADWCVLNGKTKAVAMERFMAWDNFKGTFLRAVEDGKTAVPSLLRKLFMQDFIRKNAEKDNSDPTKLKKIIAPEYAENASQFTDFLSKNLPSLNLWNTRMELYKDEYGTWDLEDWDYKLLFDSYRDFLDKNNLFEPSWVQNVKLEKTDIEFFILFPELLEDFDEYSEILEESDCVTLCRLSEDIQDPVSVEYPDSRSELRQTILQIIDLVHNQKKFDWTDIALSVPDLDTYRPYLERELKLYDVPFVIRAGIPLTKNSSARIFESIQNCYQTDFSYDSVRSLLLDECIPWKEKTVLPLNYTEDGETIKKTVEIDLAKTRESLIRHGNELHCMFPYEEKEDDATKKTDTWLKALHAQRRGHEGAGLKEEEKKDEEELALYTAIKNCIKNFYRKDEDSQGFESVLQAWFQFKERFINDSDFSAESNQILSRCIVHLQEMMTLENDYCLANKMVIPSPYDFFVRELSQKRYTLQTEQNGISIFDYRLSAEACFPCQFVINASQKQIDVQYKKLDFLNATKRSRLNLLNNSTGHNPSKVFAYLYTNDIENKVPDLIHIFSAVQSFDGFTIPHSCLSVKEQPVCLDENDYILAEKNWIASGCKGKLDIQSLPYYEAKSLSLWKNNAEVNSCKVNRDILKARASHSLIQDKDYLIQKGIIQYDGQLKMLIEKNRDKKVIGFIKGEKNFLEKYSKNPFSTLPKITARAELENFFPCPRNWTLSRLLKLKPDTLDITLLKSYEIGNLNHAVLEEFMKDYLGESLPYFSEEKSSFIKEDEDITETVKKQIQHATEKAIQEFSKSPLVKKVLLSQQNQISDSMYGFLCILLIPFGSSINSNGERQNIAGLGKCTVYGVENISLYPSENADYFYTGVIDCLLKSPRMDDSETEGWIIIDWKSSSASIPRAADIYQDENGLLHDFQMPMYITLILAQSDEKNVDAAYYYSLRKEKKSYEQKKAVIDRYVNSEKKDLTQKSFEPVIKKFTEYADVFSKKCMDVPEPYISYDSKDSLAVRAERDCTKCDFKSICRTTYSIAERNLKSLAGANK
ncbi:MAG: PD-(D/E)XK nuclease family protein [Treponema sp.]|nr:PD-(D/E)XK nuclease family protein [Treponema sp.]